MARLRRSKTGFILGVALGCVDLVAWSSSCYAASDTDAAGDFSSSGTYWMLFKVFFFLIVIIGIFLLIVKFVARKNRSFQSARSVKSIGGVSLGQNKSVQVVEIGHSLYVLGVGNDVQLIGKIDDPDEVNYIRDNIYARTGSEFATISSVGNWFKSLKSKPQEEEDITTSFQQVFQEKMQGVANRKRQVDDLIRDQTHEDRLNDKR